VNESPEHFMPRLSLVVNLIPLTFSLAILALQAGVGPQRLLYGFSQVAGPVVFGCLFLAPGLILIALIKTRISDCRVIASILSFVASVTGTLLFIHRT
jgi:hypothetical protein